MCIRDLTGIRKNGSSYTIKITDFLIDMKSRPNIVNAFVLAFLKENKYYFDNKEISLGQIFNPSILNDKEKQIIKEGAKYGS